MSSKLKDTDRGYKALVKRVYGAKKPVIEAGILEKDGGKSHGDGLSVLEVATFNEFGLGVPERSFLRAYFDQNQARIRKMLAALMVAVLKGTYTKDQALHLLAQKIVGEIQKRMADGIPPPNAPSTILKKGSSTPLIDTGQLRSSISYRIKDK